MAYGHRPSRPSHAGARIRRPARPSHAGRHILRPNRAIRHSNPSNCSIVDRAEIEESMQVFFEISSMATRGGFNEDRKDEFIKAVKDFQRMVYAQLEDAVASGMTRFSVKPDAISVNAIEEWSEGGGSFSYWKARFDFPDTREMSELSHLDDYDHEDITINIHQVFVDWLAENNIQSYWGHDAEPDRIERP